MKTLESKDNPRIRQLAKLAESPRETAKQGLALLDGVHLIQALLQSGHAPSWGVVTPSAQLKKEIREALQSAESQGTEWFGWMMKRERNGVVVLVISTIRRSGIS